MKVHIFVETQKYWNVQSASVSWDWLKEMQIEIKMMNTIIIANGETHCVYDCEINSLMGKMFNREGATCEK